MGRLLWFICLGACLALGAHLFFASYLTADAQASNYSLSVHDRYANGVHSISGMYTVPSECHDLFVRAQDINGSMTALVFETWEQPYRDCKHEPTPRAFQVQVFGSSALEFRAIANNNWIPIRIAQAL